jgi:hypothetical protein
MFGKFLYTVVIQRSLDCARKRCPTDIKRIPRWRMRVFSVVLFYHFDNTNQFGVDVLVRISCERCYSCKQRISLICRRRPCTFNPGPIHL